MPTLEYAELYAQSNFSFLEGASHPAELVLTAAQLGYRALAITDRHTLSGTVRAHVAAKEHAIQYIVGALIEFHHTGDQSLSCSDLAELNSPHILTVLTYPTNRVGYGNLCRLITLGRQRAGKDQCLLTLTDLFTFQDNLIFIVIPQVSDALEQLHFLHAIKTLRNNLNKPDALSLALHLSYQGHSQLLRQHTLSVAQALQVKLVATGAVLYHTLERRVLQDVLSCIRAGCTIQQAGFRLQQNAERYLKSTNELHRLFREHPAALRRTLEIAELTKFSLDELRYEYPEEIVPEGESPLEYLTQLTWAGAHRHYPHGIPDKVIEIIKQELLLIHELNYEKYFLTCYDIVKFARQRNILCQGRGAAANSAVCYCLGITAVDPDQIELLFARFVSKERQEPPDIDIDFEHERREEVIQYIYEKYGRDRAALVCEVITYRQRSAVRDVGKALGLSKDMVERITKAIYRWTGSNIERALISECKLDANDLSVRHTIALSKQLLGFPRHISQHVGGFVISKHALCETVPIRPARMEARTIIEWDKDDVEALGLLKVDILALGMLTAIRKALDLINTLPRYQSQPLMLHSIPSEDSHVYDMICAADTVGVFQIESRAQMSMLPRLKPRCFYDLVIEVAIVRPGPIQGKMVHPYLKRRSGIEKPFYPDQRVADVLGKTLGVPLFQEQAMRLAIVLANFTPGEAERLRRSMAAWKRSEESIIKFQEKILAGITANGYSLEFAQSCMNQLKGFAEYGFPESHAASFALLVYASAWIKKYFPAQFAAALINSQPMGFYAPAQLVRDAQQHGINVLIIDINYSRWECTIENNSLRLGMCLIKGLQESQARLLSSIVQEFGKINSILELWQRASLAKCRLRKVALQALAKADAFTSLGIDRHQALWAIKALAEDPLPLDQMPNNATQVSLPELSTEESMFRDYRSTGLSLRAHPLNFIREKLDQLLVSSAATLRAAVKTPRNRQIAVAGIVLVRQRPGTAKGVVFITLEDETGVANLIIRPNIFEKYQQQTINSSCLLAYGTLERSEQVVYVNVSKLESLDSIVRKLGHSQVNYAY